MSDTEQKKPSLERLLLIQMLYSFVVAAMAVIVPLYLLEQKVDITWIGLILSIGPISFMVIRVTFASMADEIGTKAIAAIYSASNIISILLYLLIASPVGFAFATLAEGVRASGFWAIARTEMFEANGTHDPGKSLAHFSNMRQLADGLGRLMIGFVLTYLAFQGAFLLMLFFSLILVVLTLTNNERQNGKIHIGADTFKHIFKERPKEFWYSSFLQLLIWLPINMLIVFLIPIYLSSSLRMGYYEVGMLLAVFSLANAVFGILFMRLNFSKWILLFFTALSAPALVLFPLMPGLSLPLLFVLAIGGGCGIIMGEYMLLNRVYHSPDVSTDIGVIYAPLKIAEFLFLSLGGFAIMQFGFAPLFFVLAVSITLFVLLGRNGFR